MTARIGVLLLPQATSIADIRAAWCRADAMGFDSIWMWDHFFPQSGDLDASHFEGWTLLSVMAADTQSAMIGMLVSGHSYRNVELVADMARTLDHVSGGRMYLGIGTSWAQRDHEEYGFEYGTAASRMQRFEGDVPRMLLRLSGLNPPPIGRLPLLIRGSCERVALPLVARHAAAWNTSGSAAEFAASSLALTRCCEAVGREPATIERTVTIAASEVGGVQSYVEAGAHHVIFAVGHPFDLSSLAPLLRRRDRL